MPSFPSRRQFLAAAGSGAAVAGSLATFAAATSHAAENAAAKPLKILGICCSPRKGKTTATALQLCLDSAKAISPRIAVEMIELAGLKIPGQVAAGLPLDPGERDDYPSLLPKLLDPEVAAVILGTPVYFGNMSYLCKAFIDRCMAISKPKAWRNKVGGVVATGGARNGGLELTVRSVQASLMAQQMIVVGDAPPTGHWGGTVWAGAPAAAPAAGVTSSALADTLGAETVKNLGRRIGELVLQMTPAAS
jgi:multimeric flavodoxin WrbA